MLKTGMRAWSNSGGKRIASSSCGWPSTRAGAPPVSSPFATTSTVSGVPASACIPTTTGSRRAPRLSTFETTIVRTPRRCSSASVPDDANRRENVAVARAVERRLPVFLDEHAAVGPQARRSGLAEPEWVSEPLLRHVRADDLVRREARHQGNGDLDAERLAQASGLAELDLEEAPAVDRLGDRLHAAAEARRHPAGEHDHRHRSRLQPVDTGRLGLGEARVARLRQRQRDPTAAAARPRPEPRCPPPSACRRRAGGGAPRTARRRSRAARASRASAGSISSRITASPPARAATPRTVPGGCPPRSRSPRSGRPE